MSSLDAVVTVIDAIETCQIEYMVVGAVSSNVYGVARNTSDVDFVVKLKQGQFTKLMATLGNDYQHDPQMQLEGFTGSLRNVVTHVPTGFQIELFRLNAGDEHHLERFRRRRQQKLTQLNRIAWLPTPKDVIIQKLRWKRRKDLDDVVNVLAVSGKNIDWTYLRSWTMRHGTDSLLDELLAEIPPVLDEL